MDEMELIFSAAKRGRTTLEKVLIGVTVMQVVALIGLIAGLSYMSIENQGKCMFQINMACRVLQK